MSGAEPARVVEERELREFASQLRALSSSPGAEGKMEDIEGFASEAEGYAQRIHDAEDDANAATLIAEASSERPRWTELYDFLCTRNDAVEALAEAEEKLRRTATQLRAVSGTGVSPVFTAIGVIAGKAETALQDFVAAATPEAKWEVISRFEAARTEWAAEMTTLQANIAAQADDELASTAAPSAAPSTAGDDEASRSEWAADEALDICVPGAEVDVFCEPMSSAAVGWTGTLATTSVAAAATTRTPAGSAEAHHGGSASSSASGVEALSELTVEQMARCLTDDDEGLLPILRKAVPKVLQDERFEGVHGEATTLLEQLELAAGAVLPELLPPADFSDDLAGAEGKLKATMEPMRKAQWGGFYAKQAAWKVRKYDSYVAKGTKPKLRECHPELLTCAVASIRVGDYLHKRAQNAIMASVTGLVAQTARE